VHRDSRPLFGTEFESPPPAHMLVANILLCDFTVENGSTEVWPGSHLLCDTYQGRAHPLDLEERARYLPSRRLNAPAGSIVLRDLRLWHRGTPNRSGANRSMLSPVYRRSWLGIAPAEVPPERLESWAPETRRLFDR
jgi:ectoine hydroxylase-related dioxygenase (phytanoyl-CoA dioxygenase family)